MSRPGTPTVVFFYSLFVLLFALIVPAHATDTASSVNSPKPHVLVVVADDLTWTDFHAIVTAGPSASPSTVGADGWTLTLMSPGRPIGDDPVASVYATLGAGDSIATGDISEGLLCRELHKAGRRVALIGNADGDDTGLYRPALHFIPQPDDIANDDGTVADPLAPGGRRIDPSRLTAVTMQALTVDDLVVVHDGDFDRLEREARAGWLTPAAYRLHRRDALSAFALFLNDIVNSLSRPDTPTRLLLIGAGPSPAWDHLTPIAVADFGASAEPDALGYRLSAGIATSDTTRTPGLIAARDIAPSILATLGVPTPIQMTGAVVRGSVNRMRDGVVMPIQSYGHGAQAVGTLDTLDRITTLDQQVAIPFFWVLGFAGGLTVLASLLVVAFGARRPSGPPTLVLYGLRIFAGWPLALLLAPLCHPASIGAYIGWICLIWLAIGLLPSPQLILFTTALVIVADAFVGSPLVAASLLSAYRMAGIRFYGIGNEYMGVLIGGALMAPILYSDGKRRHDTVRERTTITGFGRLWLPLLSKERVGVRFGPIALNRLLLALWFALVIFVLSFPAFGAKAGGAVTALATFLFAAWELRRVPIGVARVVGAVAAGFVLVFIWAVLARWLRLTPTHIDAAVAALSSGRFGYILGVATRKVGLALRVGLHPGTILGILGILLLCALVRALLGGRLRALWRTRPVYAAITGAGLRGCVVAVLFNDSGIIAAILLSISLMLPNLYALFTEGERESWQ